MSAARTLLRKQRKLTDFDRLRLTEKFPGARFATFERKIGKKGTPNARFYLVETRPGPTAKTLVGRFHNATKGRSLWRVFDLPVAA